MTVISERDIAASKLDTDPVCGMSVYRAEAREHDLVIVFAEREYVFCAPGCRDTFLHDPVMFAVVGRDRP